VGIVDKINYTVDSVNYSLSPRRSAETRRRAARAPPNTVGLLLVKRIVGIPAMLWDRPKHQQ